MLRAVLVVALVIAVLLVASGEVFAQQAGSWPGFPLQGKNWRGPGYYLSWLKILACWLVFLVWVGTTDWLSRDCQELRLNYLRWNPIAFGTFLGAFVLVWLVPYFWVGFPLLLVAHVAPLTTYIIYRNSKVTNDQRVLTPEHLRYWGSIHLKKFGLNIEAQSRDPHESGPPVKVSAHGGATERDNSARLLAARQSPGLLAAREVIALGFASRASAIMLDFAQQGVGVNYMIDGVWLNRETQTRENADPALEALKLLCGLNPKERQNRQEGTFMAEYSGIRYASTMTAQGTQAGERAMIQFEDKKTRFNTLEELGMRQKLQEQLKELQELKQGLVLFSAMPGSGLRSTMSVMLRGTDRFTREFLAVEDEAQRYEDVENIPVITYKSADGETPDTILTKVFRKEPNVLVVRDLVNAKTVGMLCDAVDDGRLLISTVRAKDCAEALLRVVALGVPPAQLAKGVAGVIGQRLVRKLCEKCKEAYAPAAGVLEQLGIPAGRIQALYRPPQQQPEEVCPECNGVGYKGRTAIFEMLTVGEAVRKALAKTPKLELLRAAARKDGMRSFQEEGILLAAKGVTSLPELTRVLPEFLQAVKQ